MLHERIEADLKTALKSGEKEKAGVLRFLISAIKNYQIENRLKGEEYLKDEDIIAVVRRQIKQRKDSISEYEKGNRNDLAEKERKELEMIENYVPAQMGEEKIREMVRGKIVEFGVSDKASFGKIMGAVMKETQGKADGGEVKRIVEEELNGD